MPKRGPNVLVTGTPGCGKSSLCEAVVRRCAGSRHVMVGDVVKAKGLHAGVGAHGALMIDEASEDKIVDELESDMAGGGVLLEHHSVDFFPERWFDLVIVLRTDNTVLFDRLTKRCGRASRGVSAPGAVHEPQPLHAASCSSVIAQCTPLLTHTHAQKHTKQQPSCHAAGGTRQKR